MELCDTRAHDTLLLCLSLLVSLSLYVPLFRPLFSLRLEGLAADIKSRRRDIRIGETGWVLLSLASSALDGSCWAPGCRRPLALWCLGG